MSDLHYTLVIIGEFLKSSRKIQSKNVFHIFAMLFYVYAMLDFDWLVAGVFCAYSNILIPYPDN